MDKVSSNHRDKAIVIAGKYDTFKVEAVQLLAQRGFEVILCDNIYTATAEISRAEMNVQTLVITSPAKLSRETKKLFQICSKRPEVTCLCFIRQETVQPKIISNAIHWGVLVVVDMEGFDEAVNKCLERCRTRKDRTFSNKMTTEKKLIKEELTLSQRELEALLEGN